MKKLKSYSQFQVHQLLAMKIYEDKLKHHASKELSHSYPTTVCRDDELGVLRNLSGPQTERKRKANLKVFKDCGLTITTQTNLKIVNFLDVQLNLGTSTYLLNRNPDNNPVYQGKSFITPQPYWNKCENQQKNVYQIYYRMKMFLHSQYLYIKMIHKTQIHCK